MAGTASEGFPLKTRARWWGAGITLAAVGLATTTATYKVIPLENTNATHFDTLIVLGCPAELDGSPSAEERERVMEAIREFRAGRAGHMILTGGAAHNQFVEAEVMARMAVAAGVPASAVIVEGKAMNTIQNIFYSDRIMQQRGWTSAEVVSSPSHLPRASLISAALFVCLEDAGRRVAARVRMAADRGSLLV